MKRHLKSILLVMLSAFITPPSHAQTTFNSGSDGSYGPINLLTSTTLQVPPSGIFHCTSIYISNNVSLSFVPNALNTPIYFLAQSNVLILGTIDVTGKTGTANPGFGGLGGPGGFEGGNPGFDSANIPPGSGRGPGAGLAGIGLTTTNGAGAAGYATTGVNGGSLLHGKIYGNPLLIPLVGGSGGGGTTGNTGQGGGGGGGAILIASNTRIDINNPGLIAAYGGANGGGAWNGGSGGAIRLVAPVVAGNGRLYVYGQGGGGSGRVRVDTLNRQGAAFDYNPNSSPTIGTVMITFPSPLPRLDILNVAGNAIAEGTSGNVTITLPFGSDPNRTVVVQARDFQGVVPISVVLTPDNGTATTYPASIDMSGGNPSSATVNVTFPVNVRTTVNAWTR